MSGAPATAPGDDEPMSTTNAWYFAAGSLILFPLALGAWWLGWKAMRSGNRWALAPMCFALVGPVSLIVLTATGSAG